MIVGRLVPRAEQVELESLLGELSSQSLADAEPFGSTRIAFSDAVSRAIFHHPRARAFPEVIAAAFWLRRAAVERLAERFASLTTANGLRAPRGLVFHLPPSNVDTLFLYTLMLSFLVGNRNVVRVSRSRGSEQVALLCEVLRGVLAEERFGSFADALTVISYDHEPEPTAELSTRADVRLLWGGDETVQRLRAVAVGPATHELTFGDRFSLAALRPEAVLERDDGPFRPLAERLFDDAYWFDQRACSSPRLVVWVGDEQTERRAREQLWDELARVVSAKGYKLEPGAALAKMTFVYGALIDRPVENVLRRGNELTVLRLADLAGFERTHPGAGLFFEARIDSLSDLVGFVRRKDQTLTTHGFGDEELADFAAALQDRGIDRIVPFGDALLFDSVWDGYDLLAELSRTIDLVPAA